MMTSNDIGKCLHKMMTADDEETREDMYDRVMDEVEIRDEKIQELRELLDEIFEKTECRQKQCLSLLGSKYFSTYEKEMIAVMHTYAAIRNRDE